MTICTVTLTAWHLVGLICTLAAIWAGSVLVSERCCPACRERRERQ